MKLERIVPGSRLPGIAGDGAVEVVATRPYGPDAIEVVWRGPDGLGDRILYREDEPRIREVCRDCYWLFVVTNCASAPELQEPTRDPARFPWHKAKKVQHYWLDVLAMTGPMSAADRDNLDGGSPA